MIRAAENIGGGSAVTQMVANMVESGFLSKLLQGLRGSWIAHCTTGPLKKSPPVDGIVETDYFSVLARLVLGSTRGFMEGCRTAGTTIGSEGSSTDTTMKWLLEEWFSHFENVGDPSRRKLMCLALTKLLETNAPFILVNLQSLMTVWTDVITELRADEEDVGGDSLVYANGDAFHDLNGTPEAPEEGRRRSLTTSDVVHTVNLPAYVKEKLQQAVSACGGEQQLQQEWLVNVDRNVLEGFTKLGIM